MSKEFATLCANQLSDLGIEVFVFDSLRPTPELSFTVRELNCTGGIVITASHNPKEYNGYKVYDETGCQLVPEKVEKVIELISEVESELDILKPVGNPSMIHWINEEIDERYKEAGEVDSVASGFEQIPAQDRFHSATWHGLSTDESNLQ